MAGLSRIRDWILILAAMLLAAPWLALKLSGFHGSPTTTAVLTGMAILGAAFILSWAAEVVQMDITQALAIAILSLIAVFPEYSVDIYLAWKAGQDPAYGQYALANMTGGNRLLIGVGWSLVILLYWWRTRRPGLRISHTQRLEISILVMATLYALILPIKGTLSVIDAVILVGLFIAYLVATSRQKSEELELVGPAKTIGDCRPAIRRLIAVGLMGYSALAILSSAEPFAESLIESGRILGIDEFLLIQWLAPMASEAPEFIVAILFVLRGHATLGLRTMISSKVNQWTLLVGTLPIAYSISAGGLQPLILDDRQAGEVLLTAAQSAFAVALVAGLRFPVWGGIALLSLFAFQLMVPELHLPFSGLYLVLALGLFALNRSRRRGLLGTPGWLLRQVKPGVAAPVRTTIED